MFNIFYSKIRENTVETPFFVNFASTNSTDFQTIINSMKDFKLKSLKNKLLTQN